MREAPPLPNDKQVPIVRVVAVTVTKERTDTPIGLVLEGDSGAPRVKAMAPHSLVANTKQLRVDQRLLEVRRRRLHNTRTPADMHAAHS